jgi:hypothetical protein
MSRSSACSHAPSWLWPSRRRSRRSRRSRGSPAEWVCHEMPFLCVLLCNRFHIRQTSRGSRVCLRLGRPDWCRVCCTSTETICARIGDPPIPRTGNIVTGNSTSPASSRKRSGPACIITQACPNNPARSAGVAYSKGNPRDDDFRCERSKPIAWQNSCDLVVGLRVTFLRKLTMTRAMHIHSAKLNEVRP